MSSRSMRPASHCATLAPSVAICDTAPVGRFELPCANGPGRWVRRSTKARANSKQSGPRREDYSPGMPQRSSEQACANPNLYTSQRDEYSLCTSKFESDMPSHAVGLTDGVEMRFPCRSAPPSQRRPAARTGRFNHPRNARHTGDPGGLRLYAVGAEECSPARGRTKEWNDRKTEMA
jgi:hypothetical protein